MIRTGQLNLRQKLYQHDLTPIDESCDCTTCKNYTRAYLHHIVTEETVACHLLTVHNVNFQLKLMRDIQNSINEQKFPEFIRNFMKNLYSNDEYPQWIVDALKAVNIDLK